MSNLDVTSHQPDDERARLYVAGRLSSADAEAFEEHSFACEACWREVEEAHELREALATSARKKSSKPAWASLAAAAIVALVFLGVWQLTRREAVDEIRWRGGETALQTSVTSTDTGTVIRWQPVPDATRYSVRLLGPDGATLARRTTSTPELLAPRAELASVSHYRVQALDQVGAVLADSGLQRLQPTR